jgi:hemolysin III
VVAGRRIAEASSWSLLDRPGDTIFAVIERSDFGASRPGLWIGEAMMFISNGQPANVTWDYDRVELIADSIVHAIGVSLGVAGAIVIVIVTANSAHTADMPSIVIYTIGLLSMLGFSAAYNTWPISHAKWVLRRFDHSAIYLMIAGTYTAFIGQMKGDYVWIGLLIGIWLTAVVGVTLKLLLPGRFDRLAVVLYLILGWSGAFVYEPVAVALPSLSI